MIAGEMVTPGEALTVAAELTVVAENESKDTAIEVTIRAAITIASFSFTFSSPFLLRDRLFMGPYLSISAPKNAPSLNKKL
jgi:hypothetical protein